MRGVFWLWVLPAWRLAMLSQVRRLLEYKETGWLPPIAALSFPDRDSHNTYIFASYEMSSTDTSLLDILETHGKKFLDSFKPRKNKRKRADGDTSEAHRSTKLVRFETDQVNSIDGHSDAAMEEWSGFGGSIQVDDEYAAEDEASFEGVFVQLRWRM